jgi:hypothetical protein
MAAVARGTLSGPRCDGRQDEPLIATRSCPRPVRPAAPSMNATHPDELDNDDDEVVAVTSLGGTYSFLVSDAAIHGRTMEGEGCTTGLVTIIIAMNRRRRQQQQQADPADKSAFVVVLAVAAAKHLASRRFLLLLLLLLLSIENEQQAEEPSADTYGDGRGPARRCNEGHEEQEYCSCGE